MSKRILLELEILKHSDSTILGIGLIGLITLYWIFLNFHIVFIKAHYGIEILSLITFLILFIKTLLFKNKQFKTMLNYE